MKSETKIEYAVQWSPENPTDISPCLKKEAERICQPANTPYYPHRRVVQRTIITVTSDWEPVSED